MARIVFMGTPAFAVPTLSRLVDDGHEVAVVTQPDRPAGRGRMLEIPPVKRVALQNNLPVVQPESVNTPEFASYLADVRPEVGVVAAFGQLLGRQILQIPKHGYLNVHASLLPRHRGASPVAAAILAGDEETGVTIMLIDEGLDTGPILAQASCPIEPTDTTATLENKLATLGAELMSVTLPRWLAGAIEPRPQAPNSATMANRVQKSDGKVDWNAPAEKLWRMCRAYNPWPGLFTYAGERRINLWRVRPLPDWQGDELPGEVIAENDDELVVATGKGALVLEEVQLAGKKRVCGRDFRRGQPGLKVFN